MTQHLSAEQRLIVALDTDDPAKALNIVHKAPNVKIFKIGLELIFSIFMRLTSLEFSRRERSDYFDWTEKFFQTLWDLEAGIFFDAKFHDIPDTVVGALRSVVDSPHITMLSVHCSGGPKMMTDGWKIAKEAAEKNKKFISSTSRPLILGVTLLTSLKNEDLRMWGFPQDTTIEDVVLRLAHSAKEAGLDGVVASPLETNRIRRECGHEFKIVNPGIRPLWAPSEDQSRFTTPAQAIQNGAHYLVVGRPITNPPKKIGGTERAVRLVLQEIEKALAERRA